MWLTTRPQTCFLPLLCRLKPHTLSAVFALHGGSLEAAEQQPMGKIAQVRWGQVTRLLLQEVLHNILGDVCRAAAHRPAGRVSTGVERGERGTMRDVRKRGQERW